MALFSSEDETKYGVIIDIGSGSVLAAIVESDPNKNYPTIVWSKREYGPLKQIDSLEQSAKSIITSLLNVLMELDSQGKKALSNKGKLSHAQVTVAAPWSYTVSKSISYKNEESFSITKPFISKLLRMARKKVQEELKENEKIHNLGLDLVSRTTADIVANGYSIILTGKQEANLVKVIELSVVVQQSIAKALDDVKNNIFPKIDLQKYSFMLALFYVVSDLYESMNDCCLVDVTFEATEIGIVRDGVLQYCTHTPFGMVSLARELSSILSIPIEEALSHLKSGNIELLLSKFTEKKQKDVSATLLAYESRLISLFQETGDKLTIPKTVFVHGDVGFTKFLRPYIESAGRKVTKSSHLVYDITKDMIDGYYDKQTKESLIKNNQDTAMLVSAQFFHKRNYEHKFEQL
ncbi:MAG: hypothetical protein R3B60_04785 [Candidatus Paceibacterota bacterium]